MSTGINHIQKNLHKLANQVMKTSREDLRRTKAFLRDQEQTQETLNGEQ